MTDIKLIRKAIADLQANMVKGMPPLLVVENANEVIGITTIYPALKPYTVSKEQYERSKMQNTWQGTIILADKEIENENKIKTENNETCSSLRQSEGRELHVPQRKSEEPGRQEPLSFGGQHSKRIQEKQNIPKTSKK